MVDEYQNYKIEIDYRKKIMPGKGPKMVRIPECTISDFYTKNWYFYDVQNE